MRTWLFACVFATGVLLTAALAQNQPVQIPVRELVVFKDGHAYVIHEGEMPTTDRGAVVLDYLPTPILGTFWAYSADPQVKLQAVVAGQRRVTLKRTALSLQEMLEANPGARVLLTEASGAKLTGVIVGMPARSSQELEETSPPNMGDRLPQKGQVLLLKTDEGTRAMPLNRVVDITFLSDYNPMTSETEFRNLLALYLNWGTRQPQKTARVGMMYVQRGVRWIPQYRLVLDGKGNAKMYLQASLINELTDLRNTTVDLVIGVPSFAYKETPDPISLQQTFAQLSPYFRAGTDRILSNALMSQAPGAAERVLEALAPPLPADTGPEVAEAGSSEDLFVFTVKGISLRKGERMTLPVSEYALKYSDIYTLHVPPSGDVPRPVPAPEPRLGEIQSVVTGPRVIHKVRLVNTTEHPFTTAPLLLFSGDSVLAQDTMTYTPRRSTVDIPIATAVNIPVKQTDRELKRTEKALTRSGMDYALIEVEGTLTLINYSDKAVDLEVTRLVVGEVQNTSPEVEVTKLGASRRGVARESWIYPGDTLNPLSQIVWKVALAPGKSIDLKCSWRYYSP